MTTYNNISGDYIITPTGQVQVSGNTVVTGNISGNYILGNGSFLTGVVTSGTEGATGPQGPSGNDGATGASGFDGASGPQGPLGNDGATGASGFDGASGPQGPQGYDGATGPQGPSGTSVTIIGSVPTVGASPQVTLNAAFPGASNGDGVIALNTGNLWVLTSGTWNDVGTIVGPQGATGASGLIGSTGPQGPQGFIGSTGPQGPQGATGSGATGASGVAGTNGATGASGVAGTNGATGASGLTGATGSATIGGANTYVLFNDSSTANGTAGFTFNKTSNLVTVSGNLTAGNLVIPSSSNLYLGGTAFTRTLVVGRPSTPVTVPLATNNSFNVLTIATGNVAIYTT